MNSSDQPTFLISENGSTSTSITSTGTLTTGTWTHLAAVFDPNNSMRLYVNGILDGELTTGVPASIHLGTANLWIGLISSVADANAIDAVIDEVRIWNTARTAAEIQDNMHKEFFFGTISNLVSYYRFDEDPDITSTSLPDLNTTNANTGTLTNLSPSNDWVDASAREPFKTTNGGSWNSTGTWKTRTIPNAGTSIIDQAHDLAIGSAVSADVVNVNSGNTLTLNANLTTDNDVINNGTIAGGSTLIFNSGGAFSPVITGGTFSNIQFAGGTVSASLQGNTTLTGDLDLNTSGTLALGEHDLTVSTISNFNASNNIVTLNQNSSGGDLIINIAQSDGEVTFPIASSGTGTYTPVTILNLGTTGNMNVRVFDDVFADGTSGLDLSTASQKEVAKSWEITGDAGVNVTITLQWNGTDEGTLFTTERASGMNDEIYISRHSGLFWAKITPDGAASGSDPYTKSVSGITTFSVFGLGSTDSFLPIGLSALSATAQDGQVFLDWQTVSEFNNDRFEVERSVDGEEFDLIGMVDGSGNSSELLSYSFLDAYPYEGVNYYRLKQVDFDGSFEYSEVVSAEISTLSALMRVYPNPLKDVVTVDFERNLPPNSSFRLMTVGGAVLNHVVFNREVNQIQLDLSAIPTGVYLLQISAGSEVYVERLSKE